MPRLLFVCLGNICRSPAAENVMRHTLIKAGKESQFQLDSAGTAGWHIGKIPDSRMRRTLQARGIPVSGRARQFCKEDFEHFDLILTMDESNYSDVISLAQTPSQKEKVRPFSDFLSQFTEAEVPDPYYGEQNGFDYVTDLLIDGCQQILINSPPKR